MKVVEAATQYVTPALDLELVAALGVKESTTLMAQIASHVTPAA